MGASVASADSHGVDLELQLERDDVVPGSMVKGSISIRAGNGVSARSILATLIATEQWKYRETTTDGQGHTTTRVVTRTSELQRVPVALSGPVHLAPGEDLGLGFEVPVPGLGPATLEATVSRLTWTLEVKLDREGAIDAGIVAPIRVLQPTALLRAGVVRVGEFALFEAADSSSGEARASVEIKPMPICVGAPIRGVLTIETNEAMDLQELRLELRVKVEATVGGGEAEELTVWTGRLAGPGPFGGASQVLHFDGEIPPTFLPTIELPHGRSEASFHVILARAWSRDPHLVRDVTICSTTEI